MVVVCINPRNVPLTKGKRYIVQDDTIISSCHVYRVTDDHGDNHMCYSSKRFITLDQWKQSARDMIYSKVKLIEPTQKNLNEIQRQKTIELWNKYVHRRLKN